MATEDFTDCLFPENDSMVDVQVLDYSSYTLKDGKFDENEDTYEDNTECLIVSDGEHSDTFTMDEISSNLGPNSLTLITLPDGSQAYVGANDLTQVELDEDGTLLVQDYPSDGTHQIQLDDGTFATLHATPKDNNEQYQAVAMEDGTTTYISLSDLARTLSATDKNEALSEEPFEDSTLSPEDSTLSPEGSTLSPEEQLPPTVEVTAKEKAPKCHQCPIVNCGKLYTTTHHLKVHQRAHTGDRPFRCPEEGCTKAFATGYGCKAHVRTHTGEKPYKCPDSGCIKCFKTSGDLQKHIRVHTGERPFMCPMPNCGRSFTTSNIRKVHYRTHTGERPYTCTMENCGRAFASATNFKNHMRIHSGEKPYQCSSPGCEKRFTEYSSLYKHNLVHTQQKPYHCTACERTYRQASTLTMHKRTAHGIVETDDGTEIILGETVFTLADTDGGGKRLKALGSNLLGIRDGNRIMSVHTSDGSTNTQQFLVVADSAQLAAFQELELGCTSFLEHMDDTVEEDDIASDSIF